MRSADDDEDHLDADDFPLGDGTADSVAVVACPYCAQDIEITLDPGGGSSQTYVQDCEVCCRPWQVHVSYRSDGTADVEVETLD